MQMLFYYLHFDDVHWCILTVTKDIAHLRMPRVKQRAEEWEKQINY